jgi:hypothetical protein
LHLRRTLLRLPSCSHRPQRRALPSPPRIHLYSVSESRLLYAPAHAISTCTATPRSYMHTVRIWLHLRLPSSPSHAHPSRLRRRLRLHLAAARAARTASAPSPPSPLHPHPRLSRCLRIGYFAGPSLPYYHLYVRSSYTSSSVQFTIQASLPPFCCPRSFSYSCFFLSQE